MHSLGSEKQTNILKTMFDLMKNKLFYQSGQNVHSETLVLCVKQCFSLRSEYERTIKSWSQIKPASPTEEEHRSGLPLTYVLTEQNSARYLRFMELFFIALYSYTRWDCRGNTAAWRALLGSNLFCSISRVKHSAQNPQEYLLLTERPDKGLH